MNVVDGEFMNVALTTTFCGVYSWQEVEASRYLHSKQNTGTPLLDNSFWKRIYSREKSIKHIDSLSWHKPLPKATLQQVSGVKSPPGTSGGTDGEFFLPCCKAMPKPDGLKATVIMCGFSSTFPGLTRLSAKSRCWEESGEVFNGLYSTGVHHSQMLPTDVRIRTKYLKEQEWAWIYCTG